MALLTTRQRNNFNRHNGGPARLGRLGDRLRLLDVDGTISGGFGQASFVADGDIAANDIITTSGYDGVTGFLKMKKADADTEVLTKNLYWSSAIVLSGATGTALKSGNFVSTLNGTIGEAVYLSTTAGRVTLEAPSGDNFVIEVGVLATTGATGRVDVELGGEKILIHDHSDDASGGSVSATPAVAGTTSAAFEVDTDGVVPALAIGSQAAGTGPFTQTLKPASTLTSGDADITIPDTAGAAGVVTLIGSTQTLTDKTLTDPTINAATITGAITITTPTVTGTWTNLGTVTTTDINGGSIDGVIIGAAAAAAGSFTTISTTGAATVDGALTCASVVGNDASLGITGLAGAGGGAGAIVAVVGGIGHTNGAGGAVTAVGGGGAGTGAGGLISITGGDSGAGATGNGGAASLEGGDAVSTNGSGGTTAITGGEGAGTGNGGQSSISGGESGSGATGTGGAISITAGHAASTDGEGGTATVTGGDGKGTEAGGAIAITSGGSEAEGTAGAIAIETGSPSGGTAGAIAIGATETTTIAIGKAATAASVTTLNGAVKGEAEGYMVHSLVVDASAAEIRAGHVLVTVPAGRQFQLVDLKQIAIGGTATTSTTVDIAGSATIAATDVASLVDSTVVPVSDSGVTVLADGASFTAQSAGTDITVNDTGGGALAGCTSIRFIISYLLI